MRKKRNTIYLIGLIVVVIIALFVIFILQNRPVYQGNLTLDELNEEVTVYFDEVGVPHIFAQNDTDAYKALGYVHAQDRLWQMELMRRIAAGRLSEIFGKDLIKTDKLFRSLGLDAVADQAVDELDTTSPTYQLSRAYLQGVNQFIDRGATPLEFRILGIKKEHYTLKDVYNVFGYMAFSFAQAYKTDPLLTSLKESLGDAYLKDLDLDIDPGSTLIRNSRGVKRMALNLSGEVSRMMENLPVAPFTGSNSWVLGPQKTKNGKVILANDPHIGYAQPSVWYQAHIVTPDTEIYGFHLGLCPFPILGHNADFAYGITMFENDDIDFYVEGDGQIETRLETIKVKGEKDLGYEVQTGVNGPVVNAVFDEIDNEKPISIDWTYVTMPSDLLTITYDISRSTTLLEFKNAVSLINAPGLNMMYGDARGNIAWFAAGQLYEKKEGVSTKFILDGTHSNDTDKTMLDFEMNPQAINPSWHYVYSANNQPEEVNGKRYPGYYVPEDRAKRIVDLIESNDEFTSSEVVSMINDVISPVSPQLVKIVIDNVSKVNLSNNEKSAIEILKKWNGAYAKEEIAPTIYFKFVYHFLKNTFRDEMGEETFRQFLQTHLYKRQIAKQMKLNKSVWWDDVNTKEIKELKDEIITRSFHETISELETQFGDDLGEWMWSGAITLTHRHAFDKSALNWLFNVGPFSIDGGFEVINSQLFKLNDKGIYEISAGPSTRRVIDFSDVENSLGILPTGQSGNLFSKHYKDQAEKFNNGEFVKMMLNKDEIRASEDVLLFIPRNEQPD